jgi:hypothetical protein
VKYLEDLKKNSELKTVKILIGEAPPFYRASIPIEKRSYFYNPKEVKYTPWFGALYKKFILEGEGDKEKGDKSSKLIELASKGVLLIDIFPFPIIQSTEVRMEVTGNFSEWITTYFKPFIDELLNYLSNGLKGVKFEFGMAATKYAATQFLLGTNVREILLEEPRLLKQPITTSEFVGTIKFHSSAEVIFDEVLFLPIHVQKKDGKFDSKYNDYFEFVVTIVYSDQWLDYKGDSVSKFVKGKMEDSSFLEKLNEKLQDRNLLPIYSADSIMISLEEGVFFNSK